MSRHSVNRPLPAAGCIRDRMRHLSRRGFVAAAISAALPNIGSAALAEGAASPRPIDVNSRDIPSFDTRDRGRTRFGSLEFRSGIVMTSPYRGFGGISAFRFLDAIGEKFLALSDKGDWLTGRLAYSAGKVSGLADVRIAPILGPDGQPVATRDWFDTESLALDGDIAYVGIERVNQILKFDFGRDGVRASGEPLALPAAAQKLPFNKGIESLALVPKQLKLGGALIAISERGLDASGNILGFLIGGPQPGQFSVRRTQDYDISDCVVLPRGDLLILERYFSILVGVRIRIRRIAQSSIAPGRVLDGRTIFEADLGNEVDNMEALEVHQLPNGDTILTMVSDDNFSVVQRNLLLQFALVD